MSILKAITKTKQFEKLNCIQQNQPKERTFNITQLFNNIPVMGKLDCIETLGTQGQEIIHVNMGKCDKIDNTKHGIQSSLTLAQDQNIQSISIPLSTTNDKLQLLFTIVKQTITQHPYQGLIKLVVNK